MFKSNTTPNRAGWFILVIAGIILAASYYETGARDTIWVPLGYILGPLIVSILAIKRGEGGFSAFDKKCLSATATSVLFWWLFSSPTIAFIINLIIDWFGILPTIKKAYERPMSESKLAWSFFFLSTIVNFFAVENWSLDHWQIIIYPISMFIGTGSIALLVLFKKQTL